MDRISFLGAGAPRNLRLRRLILQPRDALEYHAAEWTDALVIVERGELQVECRSGAQASFAHGAVLAFAGLTVQCLRNAGTSPLVLSVLSRCRIGDE
jgi:hypothetical protein